jgi:hypothetical protein
MVVVGGPATGKGVLLSALGRALSALPGKEPVLLNLGGELAQALVPLSEALGVGEEVRALLGPALPHPALRPPGGLTAGGPLLSWPRP